MKNKKGTIAAITAAVAAYMEEEEKALRPAVPQRKPVMVSSLWSNYGNEELMRILWQRGIVPRVMIFGFYPEMKT
ncbi:MAG TPA: hypothetical protein VIH69_00295 [Dehalococcoidia bacterium]